MKTLRPYLLTILTWIAALGYALTCWCYVLGYATAGLVTLYGTVLAALFCGLIYHYNHKTYNPNR